MQILVQIIFEIIFCFLKFHCLKNDSLRCMWVIIYHLRKYSLARSIFRYVSYLFLDYLLFKFSKVFLSLEGQTSHFLPVFQNRLKSHIFRTHYHQIYTQNLKYVLFAIYPRSFLSSLLTHFFFTTKTKKKNLRFCHIFLFILCVVLFLIFLLSRNKQRLL